MYLCIGLQIGFCRVSGVLFCGIVITIFVFSFFVNIGVGNNLVAFRNAYINIDLTTRKCIVIIHRLNKIFPPLPSTKLLHNFVFVFLFVISSLTFDSIFI